MTASDDSEIARSLRRTWEPFLGRFGRPTEVQRRAIPAVLSGRDVLLCAPTASGKTEAVCAPLVERRLGERRPWRILYVSPTRALVNDLRERLVTPLGHLGVRVMRRTGDHRDRLVGSQGFVITTPESFDSLMCRGRINPGLHVLAGVDAVVVDEVHLLFGTARGEQVRWLVERLRRLREQAVREEVGQDAAIQVVALSATVPDPDLLAAAFLRDPVVIEVAGGRTIEAVAPDVAVPSPEHAVPAYLRGSATPEKVLVFSNSRRRVDDLAAFLGRELAPLGYGVFAHHGSLSQRVREEAERAVRDRDRVVVCATSTLEIGIDIGDIDLVVLDGPAPDVPAVLQRVGRGNRRSGATRVMACSGSVGEALVHAAMIQMARSGRLGELERGPQYAVAIQQLASYIFQAPRSSRPLFQLVALVEALLPDVDAASLVRYLVSHGDLEMEGDRVLLGSDWLEATKGADIHSTIEAKVGFEVKDEASGTVIAHGVRAQAGRGLRVGGRLLEVRGWEEYRIRVRSTDNAAKAQGEWSYVSTSWLHGAGQPQAVRAYLGIGDDQYPVVRRGSAILVFHFGGGRRRAVLELAKRAAGPSAARCSITGWTAEIHQASPVKPAWVSPSPHRLAASLADLEQLERLERYLGRPRANQHLPQDLRRREVEAWLDLPGECEALEKASWVEVEDADLEAALGAISEAMTRRGAAS